MSDLVSLAARLVTLEKALRNAQFLIEYKAPPTSANLEKVSEILQALFYGRRTDEEYNALTISFGTKSTELLKPLINKVRKDLADSLAESGQLE